MLVEHFRKSQSLHFSKEKKYINILLRLSSQKYMFFLGNMQLNVGLFVC